MGGRYDEHESYASIYRKAVHEATRTEMNRAIDKVYSATHCAVYRGDIYLYGSRAECLSYAAECGTAAAVAVREFTDDEKHAEALHKRQVYRNP